MSAAELDVVVIGDGVIGLSTALELGRAGARCQVFGASHHEAASVAAAGLLAPSIGSLPSPVQSFFDASLALYPALVDALRDFEPELRLLEGLLAVSGQAPLRQLSRGEQLSATQVATLEPNVVAEGGIFYRHDGAIDNRLLVRALRGALAPNNIRIANHDPVMSIDLREARAAVRTRSGTSVTAESIVLAAGAWSSAIAGLPRALSVVPLKGQMLAVASVTIRHPVMGDDIYLVPRGGEIAIGATVEHSGFDTAVSLAAIEGLRQSAIRICPNLAEAPVTRTWAGIRPATPDMLPILGPEPTDNRLIYACGHSKNGILLAPATARAVAALATGKPSTYDLTPFRVDRFQSSKKPPNPRH